MKTSISEAVVSVFGILVSLQTVESCSAPLPLPGYDCPEYRLVHSYDNFEERFYNASRWLMIEIGDLGLSTVQSGFTQLNNYMNGENEANQVIPMTRPVTITVFKSDSEEERSMSISVYVPPNTDLPKPTVSSITEFSLPAGTMFVRTFNSIGIPSQWHLFSNLDTLETDLKSADKQYDPYRSMAAAYYGPLTLFNRNDEVWIPAA